jgi:SAM-dependent methyltransferase
VLAELEHVKDTLAKQRFVPWYSRAALETTLHGQRSETVESYRPLAREFVGCVPVVDVGCGSGEMLEALSDLNVAAHGVDSDEELIDAARLRGLSAEAGDPVAYVAGCADESLGGIHIGRTTEALTPQQLLDLVAHAGVKLRRGGRLVVQAVNVDSPYAVSRRLHGDPARSHPISAIYLMFLVDQAGFTSRRIELRSPVPPGETLQPLPASDSTDPQLLQSLDDLRNRLNDALFACQEYALIAER